MDSEDLKKIIKQAKTHDGCITLYVFPGEEHTISNDCTNVRVTKTLLSYDSGYALFYGSACSSICRTCIPIDKICVAKIIWKKKTKKNK